MSELSDTLVICPYCGESYQPDDFVTNARERCDECGKEYLRDDSVIHTTIKDDKPLIQAQDVVICDRCHKRDGRLVAQFAYRYTPSQWEVLRIYACPWCKGADTRSGIRRSYVKWRPDKDVIAESKRKKEAP